MTSEDFNTTTFLMRLDHGIISGMVDLTGLDFRKVDMRHPKVREQMNSITRCAAQSSEDCPIFIDMSYSDISGRDFSGYDLTHVIMTGVIATHTIFAGSDLSDTQLDDARLDYADCRNAKFRYTKMYNTTIVGVNFTGADLSQTYGLRFGTLGEETVKRLGVVASIRGAKLPQNAEPLRNEIQEYIEKNDLRRKVTKEYDTTSNIDVANAPESW